jgi:LysM repeat protein
MPVNPFSIYRKLADELDLTTKRIGVITKQLQVKGWYAVGAADIQAVLNAEDNDFVPIADAEIWASHGGLQGAVLFWPVEKLIIVLAQLYQVRDQTKQAIYEVTGISDIVRGASKAQETAAAQQLKSQWGSLRIQKMQRMIERAARDLFVMMSELIPAKFSAETIQKMTDIQVLPSEQDLTPVAPRIPQEAPPEAVQQMQAQAQEAEQARQAKLQHLMQLQALMRDKAITYYRVDVESDSTIRADVTAQKQEATQFMTAASGYFAAVAPLVQQGALPVNLAVEIFGSLSRLFNLGRTVEDAVDELVQTAREKAGPPPEQKPDPKAEAAAAEQKRKTEEAAIDQRIKVQNAETDRKIKSDNALLDGQIKATQLRIEQEKLAMVQRQNFMQQYGAPTSL